MSSVSLPTQAPTNMMAGSVSTAASAATGAALTSESFDAGGGSFAPVQQAILALFKEGPVSDEVRESNISNRVIFSSTDTNINNLGDVK